MRITHPPKHSTHLTLWLGLIGAIALGAGLFFLLHFRAEKKITGKTTYLRPVPSDAELRSELKDVQYHVTRENGTETAFQNLYWDNYKPGIYVDIITGDPLFSSRDKFNGNTGRPTFSKPISADCIVQKRDTSFNMDRIEVRAAKSDAHLGHLFNDGPPPTGQRYAVNSAALKFIPVDKMEVEGYAQFLPLVETSEAGGQASQHK
jgi:methionine-R-sulfoxide reductase